MMINNLREKTEELAIVYKLIDKQLLVLIAALLSIGMLIMTSASIDYSLHKTGSSFFYGSRQLIFAIVGLTSAAIILLCPMSKWYELSWLCLAAGLILLIAVLIPGVGREVNGSMRWIPLGPVNLQSSELAIMCLDLHGSLFGA